MVWRKFSFLISVEEALWRLVDRISDLNHLARQRC